MLEAFIDCPRCGETVPGVWPKPEGQDITEAPVAKQECPNGHVFEAEYPGWSFFTEAG